MLYLLSRRRQAHHSRFSYPEVRAHYCCFSYREVHMLTIDFPPIQRYTCSPLCFLLSRSTHAHHCLSSYPEVHMLTIVVSPIQKYTCSPLSCSYPEEQAHRCLFPNPEVYLPDKTGGIVELSLEDNVAVCLVELAVCAVVHLVRQEVLDLPDGHARDLAHVRIKKFVVVQRGGFQSFVPPLLSTKVKTIK